jgi:hypothetical protein
VLAGLVWVAVPAQAGPAYPAPTVTITTDPALPGGLPSTVKAAWTIDRPGVMATLEVHGDVLVHTTVVAVWTSRQHLIKHNEGISGTMNYWDVTQAPVGALSRQAVSSRETTVKGGWGPWGDETPDLPYTDMDRLATGEMRDSWYSGPTLPRGQVQFRLVLTLEPGTHVESHSLNVAAG